MKNIIIGILLSGLACLSSCSSNEYQMYSGDARIHFSNPADSVKSYSFYFEPSSVTQDTIFFEVSTIGYTSEHPRAFSLKTVELPGTVSPEEGIHYKSLTDPELFKWYSIAPGKTSAKIPLVILRENLKDRTTYTLQIEIAENENFSLGEPDKLHRKVVFSKGLLKPNSWTIHSETYYFGKYSYNKHEWMIQQTEKNWDEEFLQELEREPGSKIFWRDKLNELLLLWQSNPQNPTLVDDDGIEINGFPN